MAVPKEIINGLWSFPIILPDNPLKNINCYVIKGINTNRNLLVDTGFNMPQCKEMLLEGMRLLGIEAKNTDVFLTHLHTDHIGLAAVLQEMGCNLLMSEKDYQTYWDTNVWRATKQRADIEGAAGGLSGHPMHKGSASALGPERFTVDFVSDGDILKYGEYELEAVSTPGHTPGHMCLYDSARKLMLLGDHVLFDISPNVSVWTSGEDALQNYIASLEKIKKYDVKYPLPAHRTVGDIEFVDRVDELFQQCMDRLEETRRIVVDHPNITAYEIAGKMTWKIRHNKWDSLASSQKWIAFGECLAYIDHLRKAGEIIVLTDAAGTRRYHSK